jgi:hypothetical protein
LRVLGSPSARHTKEPRTGGPPGERGVRGPDLFLRKSLRTYLRILKPDCRPPGPIGNILAIFVEFLVAPTTMTPHYLLPGDTAVLSGVASCQYVKYKTWPQWDSAPRPSPSPAPDVGPPFLPSLLYSLPPIWLRMRTRGVAGFEYLISSCPSQILVLAVICSLSSFWVSSFSINCYSALSSIAARRSDFRALDAGLFLNRTGVRYTWYMAIRAPYTWARQNEFRLALVALLAYIA